MKGFEQMKKIPTIKIGINRKLTVFFWILFMSSTAFAVYKTFTAIDQHTTHEKTMIEKQLVDTNHVESFVHNFSIAYFSWQQGDEAIEKRNERLKQYLTEDLQQLNAEMIRSDIPTPSSVSGSQIWHVAEIDEQHFDVLFSVIQRIAEGEQQKDVEATYHVTVHVDEQGNLVIIKNPTVSSKPNTSDYVPKRAESDGTVDDVTTIEINEFLEMFFKLYPSATEQELAYYVSNQALPVIGKDYIFAELVNPVYVMADGQVTAHITVKYLDSETKATQLSQFTLTLRKQDNWLIVK